MLSPYGNVADRYQDLQNHLCQLSLNGRYHLAPTGENLDQVLDLGTGTGIWAIEFGMQACLALTFVLLADSAQATQHPNANVIGSDLSPIQPTL